MKIVDQKVEVLYPRTVEEGVEELRKIEIAGRNCWRSEGKMTDESYKPFIANLIKRGHGSPLEFGNIMFRITTGRDVLAELTRHRIGVAFAVESQRYVNEVREEGGIRFIKPDFYLDPDAVHTDDVETTRLVEASIAWRGSMERAEADYNYLIDCGMKNQDARKALPNSTACTIVMSCNLRELLHIYDLRSSSAAYPEMRSLMRLLKPEVDKVLPGFLPEREDI